MFNRFLQPVLLKALARSPVVFVTGARQTGKSTLMRSITGDRYTGDRYTYVSLDDLRFLDQARHDPIGFITNLPKPVIIDEVQRVPDVLLAIKQDVDNNRVNGQYGLTGSAHPLAIPRIADSLAGRMEILTLHTLSQGELGGSPEQFIDHAFNPQYVFQPNKLITRPELLERMVIGGYPDVQQKDETDRNAWFDAYITTIVQRDIRDLAHIDGLARMPGLLKLLATRAGGLLNGAELARTSGIAGTTLQRYLTLLETVFLVYLLPAWHVNLSKRLVRSPKTYLSDTGLLAFENGLNPARIIQDPRLAGALLENFVVNELRKQLSWHTRRINMYHYRTQTQTEVDIILEDKAGHIVAIEIKYSDAISMRDSAGLKQLQTELGPKFVRGIMLYTGSVCVPINHQITAIPISCLWQ